MLCHSAERITKAAKELSEASGQLCVPAQADVRQTSQLKAAVDKTIAEFGRIDFVICGKRALHSPFVEVSE